MDSTNGDALYVRGLCLYYEDCIDKAVQFFIQALRMAPDHEKARLACRVSVFECIISIQIKVIVQPKLKIWWNCTLPRAIQDIDEFVFLY